MANSTVCPSTLARDIRKDNKYRCSNSSPFPTQSRALRMAAIGEERYETTAEYNVADFDNYMGQPKVFVWWILYSYSLGTSASRLVGVLELHDSGLSPTEILNGFAHNIYDNRYFLGSE